jgi:hypothetical protein
MRGRSRRKSGVLLLVLVAALLTTGCFGGGEETPSTVVTVPASVPSGPGSAAGLDEVQIVPPDGERVATNCLFTTDETPKEFVDALIGSRPVVLLFYVNGGTDDAAVLESLDRLEPSFNRFVFLQYDYSRPDEYGDLSTLLGIAYPPQLTLIDRSGIIRKVWKGYVDEGSLNQSLVNLGRE